MAQGLHRRPFAVHAFVVRAGCLAHPRDCRRPVSIELSPGITEVGGLVYRRNRPKTGKNQVRLRESPSHAAKATAWLIDELLPISSRLKRVYLYHWNSGGPGSSWDSGLFDHRGKARPAFAVLQRMIGVAPKGGASKPGKGKGKPSTPGKANGKR